MTSKDFAQGKEKPVPKQKKNEILTSELNSKSFRIRQEMLLKNPTGYVNGILQDGLDKRDSKPFWRYFKTQRSRIAMVLQSLGEVRISSQDTKSKAKILSAQIRSVFTRDTVVKD